MTDAVDLLYREMMDEIRGQLELILVKVQANEYPSGEVLAAVSTKSMEEADARALEQRWLQDAAGFSRNGFALYLAYDERPMLQLRRPRLTLAMTKVQP